MEITKRGKYVVRSTSERQQRSTMLENRLTATSTKAAVLSACSQLFAGRSTVLRGSADEDFQRHKLLIPKAWIIRMGMERNKAACSAEVLSLEACRDKQTENWRWRGSSATQKKVQGALHYQGAGQRPRVQRLLTEDGCLGNEEGEGSKARPGRTRLASNMSAEERSQRRREMSKRLGVQGDASGIRTESPDLTRTDDYVDASGRWWPGTSTERAEVANPNDSDVFGCDADVTAPTAASQRITNARKCFARANQRTASASQHITAAGQDSVAGITASQEDCMTTTADDVTAAAAERLFSSLPIQPSSVCKRKLNMLQRYSRLQSMNSSTSLLSMQSMNSSTSLLSMQSMNSSTSLLSRQRSSSKSFLSSVKRWTSESIRRRSLSIFSAEPKEEETLDNQPLPPLENNPRPPIQMEKMSGIYPRQRSEAYLQKIGQEPGKLQLFNDEFNLKLTIKSQYTERQSSLDASTDTGHGLSDSSSLQDHGETTMATTTAIAVAELCTALQEKFPNLPKAAALGLQRSEEIGIANCVYTTDV